MVLKRLKLHRFFSGVTRMFSYTQAWVSERGTNLKILAIRLFSQFRVGKNKFHQFWSPNLEKLWEKFTSAPPGKNLSDIHARTQTCKVTPVLQKNVLSYTISQNCSPTPLW